MVVQHSILRGGHAHESVGGERVNALMPATHVD